MPCSEMYDRYFCPWRLTLASTLTFSTAFAHYIILRFLLCATSIVQLFAMSFFVFLSKKEFTPGWEQKVFVLFEISRNLWHSSFVICLVSDIFHFNVLFGSEFFFLVFFILFFFFSKRMYTTYISFPSSFPHFGLFISNILYRLGGNDSIYREQETARRRAWWRGGYGESGCPSDI